MKSVVLVTGGFDPLHSGHIDYFKAAKELGDKLIVGLNSDEWLTRKKGRPFLTWEERASVIGELACVDRVINFNDDDDSATDAIRKTRSLYPNIEIIFANGGDRQADNIPELFDDNTGELTFAYGVGGDNKKNSSSWILDNWKTQKTERDWGYRRVLDQAEGYKVKELVINPKSSLSMQRHFKRAEHWYVLKGTCHIKTDGVAGIQENKVEPHSTFSIGKEVWHQGQNKTNYFCHILEVQYGKECVEDDIERRYGGGFTVDEMVTTTKNIIQS